MSMLANPEIMGRFEMVGTGRFELPNCSCSDSPPRTLLFAHPLRFGDGLGVLTVGSSRHVRKDGLKSIVFSQDKNWSGRADSNCRIARALHSPPRMLLFARLRFASAHCLWGASWVGSKAPWRSK